MFVFIEQLYIYQMDSMLRHEILHALIIECSGMHANMNIKNIMLKIIEPVYTYFNLEYYVFKLIEVFVQYYTTMNEARFIQ